MNNIGKIILNFQVIDTGDPKMLLVGDFSKWRVIENLPAFIDITLPGARNHITLPFKKNATQGYTSLSLGVSQHINCEENIKPLPDGIYEFCLRGGKDGERTKHKYYLKKDAFQEDIDKEWVKWGLEYNVESKEQRDALLYVEGFLRAAIASTKKGLIPQAKDFFHLAQKKLKSVVECKNCI